MGSCCSKGAAPRKRQKEQNRDVPQIHVKETETTVECNGQETKKAVETTETATRPPPERKQSRLNTNNLRDNKSHSLPLGKRTNFGYEKDFKAKYTLGKLLGHGQFGYTYVATEKATGNRVAVKCIEKKQMTLPISVEDVKREVRILRTLSGHENVVQFHAAFEDDDLVYIAMELCEGGELLDRILAKKDSRYSEKDAARIVRQMLNVAARCHLNGVVHRDMKPEAFCRVGSGSQIIRSQMLCKALQNFLFKSQKDDSPLKATDFGLSDYIKPGKRFHDVVGSAYYVAPEVLRRRSGPESDVWSIGVITYILLCGRRPFWDKTEAGIFNEVLKKEARFPGEAMAVSYGQCTRLCAEVVAEGSTAQTYRCAGFVEIVLPLGAAHTWVREGGDASDMPLDISVLSNMREFVKYSRLKQLALKALATTLQPEELSDLRDQFNAMDVDGNGTITLEEIRHALSKDRPWAVKESRVSEILQAMDSNMDGIVDFDEFVAATMHVHQLEENNSAKWQRRSKAAFSKFDVDGDGYITAEELKIATGLKGSVSTLLDEADTDGDGRISLLEFQKLLRQASLGSRTNSDHQQRR